VGFHVVIPARYASTRLPGKPLLDIAGRPMIQRVVEQAALSGADEVLVATDDARIAQAVHDPRRPGANVAVMTDAALPSGTDRVAAVARERGWGEATIVVNVQGDEPFVPPALIDQAAALDDGAALYFSRAPIPWSRDGAPAGLTSQQAWDGAMRHVGLYAYRVGALARITALPPSPLEQLEKLEQLRALQSGLRIVVGRCVVAPGPGIDTEHDLQRARERAARAD
jgi:3-deoxy-manno-octulosonate cytidylyltransferase (CMP-KDO synthetase)